MILTNQKVKQYTQTNSLDGILKHIELCARTAYKSEDKITSTSAKDFVDRMIKSGHLSVLEHGTVYLTVLNDRTDVIDFYKNNKYSSVVNCNITAYITTNYRVIIENNRRSDLEYITSPTKYHDLRYTFAVTTNRGVSHEIVRHRGLSFTQESTRFCNYSNSKFGDQVTYTIPEWSDIPEGKYTIYSTDIPWLNSKESAFYDGLIDNESDYFGLLNIGWKPEQAREILPNAVKTDIVITGDLNSWNHFFDLRLKGKTGTPHPNIKQIAKRIYEKIYQ